MPRDNTVDMPDDRPSVAMIMWEVVESPRGGGGLRRHALQAVLNRITDGRAVAWDLHNALPRQLSNLHPLSSHPYDRRPPTKPPETMSPVRLVRDLAALGLHVAPTFTVRRIGNAERARILDWIDGARPQTVVLEHPYTTELTPHLRRRGIHVFIDCQNVESDLAGQLVRLRVGGEGRLETLATWQTIKRWERRLFPLAEEVWLPSDIDVNRQRHVSQDSIRARCVPNVVDVHAYEPRQLGHSLDIVFPGQFAYGPNIEAARVLASHILPAVQQDVPDSRVLLLGRDHFGAARALEHLPEVVVTGEVPDTRPYLQAAGVVVVPILHGGGTRYKILEALALGLPVVSTPLGAEGLDVRAGEHLLIRDLDGFAEAIVAILRDPAYGASLGRAGRKLVEEKYSFDALERTLREALA